MEAHYLQSTVVFEALALGYQQVRVPAIVRTVRGVIVAFCEGRFADTDWAPINILLRRSSDEGRTWDDVQMLVDGGDGPASNAVPIAGRDGALHLICQKNYRQCLYFRSIDDGLSWSDAFDITPAFEQFSPEYNWRVFAPGPGHAIELRSGRLVVAVWLCNPAGADVLPGGDHRPSCVATIASDDGGRSWKRGDIIAHTEGDVLHPSECAVAEREDGSVMINIRSESACHRRIVAVSPDGLTNWSAPRFDEGLFDPVCMAGFLSCIDPRTGGTVLLFTNPDSAHDPQEGAKIPVCARVNGVIKLSRDGGKSWPEWRVIDGGPFGYSDLASSPEGIVFCIYESGVWGESSLCKHQQVTFAKFSLEWIASNPASSHRCDRISSSHA